ncbi:hypothetical protein GCM10025858_13570 [Alicyclobacillus sacchari]|uniref:sensor histidine kinase n=1 Tax=Alicyclobacillus sacchari TaxID=392010 RepID=UPI0023E9FA39|nr:hypothetical protein GCM10025858_13570 [Alicyclobacillus sacchari]
MALLERMRSEFVANVSHELKTPIAAIRGFAETLLDGGVDEEVQQKFLQTIYDESMRMGNLVSDLLELSKLEATDSRVDPVAVNLYVVLERALDRIGPTASERGIRIVTPSRDSVQVWAEPDLLLQVFLNLLANAIHYSPPGSTIRVTWDVLVDRIKVHVQDNGIGIPRESLDRVFERFYRVQKDRSRASGVPALASPSSNTSSRRWAARSVWRAKKAKAATFGSRCRGSIDPYLPDPADRQEVCL